MSRIKLLTFSFILGVGLFVTQVIYQDWQQQDRRISSKFYQLKEIARPGDMIIINSNNFMSNLFKELDGCYYSSFKVVVEHDGEKMILVSDIDDLSDPEGFYLSDMESFFSDYDQVEISLWRIKSPPVNLQERLSRLKMQALIGETPYDFAYNYRSKEGMSCIKLIQFAYGLDIFNKRNFKRAPYFNPLMCDVKLKEKFEQIMPFFKFWQY